MSVIPAPPKKICAVLPPGTSERDLTWRQGLYGSQVKMRSLLVPYSGVTSVLELARGNSDTKTDMQRENTTKTWRERPRCQPPPAGGRGPEQTPSWSRRARTLPSPDRRLLASGMGTQASTAEAPQSVVYQGAPGDTGRLPNESGIFQCNL